jgi:hypothetical protein
VRSRATSSSPVEPIPRARGLPDAYQGSLRPHNLEQAVDSAEATHDTSHGQSPDAQLLESLPISTDLAIGQSSVQAGTIDQKKAGSQKTFSAEQIPRQNCQATPRIVRVIELYSGTAPACRFAHTIPGVETRSLSIDWIADSPDIQLRHPRSAHTHQRFDLRQIQRRDIEAWSTAILGCTADEIDWIHASVDCQTLSNASACMGIHRRPDGAPRSTEANMSDTAIGALISILRELVTTRPGRLITVENPENGKFTAHPSVRLAVAEGGFQLYYSHHCASAAPDLDGHPDRRHLTCPPIFPQKGSVWLATGVPYDTVLPRCQNTCPMRIEGTNLHHLVICRPSATRTSMHPSQKKITDIRAKSAIPLGIFRFWWVAAERLKKQEDGYASFCAVCGSHEGEMLMCDNPLCNRVEHWLCDQLAMNDPPSGTWLCHTCRLSVAARLE